MLATTLDAAASPAVQGLPGGPQISHPIQHPAGSSYPLIDEEDPLAYYHRLFEEQVQIWNLMQYQGGHGYPPAGAT
jgi:hypothetical protein